MDFPLGYRKLATVTVGERVGDVVVSECACKCDSREMIFYDGEFYQNALKWIENKPIEAPHELYFFF